ncbi:MAG: hypothetical protein GW762_05305 [Candidatus Pacebacteria bacterium]|nr:hypothetical protein [Candidatus Paceibacterota bacterium]PIR63820.1 MAG: hypothetical protein COU64_02515 [Candidatus Pacebacteria bacterium CG10_big_fil_rev_8_21_14_0_10_40_26]PIZ78791.1 MAG: hypothetical protein COY01_03265 [Candidatus Pacebacteria bacterium CG_4_10_14_0_2_um_filter_40_20]PJA68774.1 MAG: hypothetical protein CO156_03520 [Candidatus Pacebacteria bacterium CG_4_9_14_3_um_filter_40_12]PJC41151.1 MAG: hypothetical protein CO041_06005 [Candidatus Pacebacteria bacterium CG_4_9_
MARKRKEYEFSMQTKDSVINSWHAQNPGRHNAELEVDHIIPIWWARQQAIPPEIVKTRDNARALTKSEHKRRHKNELSHQEYVSLAQTILGWARNLI